ncbi:cysteine ase [Lecanosticta acicola]|uniref:Cysteine ase, partial n=1 Tax=Lecanosticta acicola TaxID=111012 RepID=A0AAI9EAB7_9PEZI|nr:cysteine ase [Lecanosticta acicola]
MDYMELDDYPPATRSPPRTPPPQQSAAAAPRPSTPSPAEARWSPPRTRTPDKYDQHHVFETNGGKRTYDEFQEQQRELAPGQHKSVHFSPPRNKIPVYQRQSKSLLKQRMLPYSAHHCTDRPRKTPDYRVRGPVVPPPSERQQVYQEAHDEHLRRKQLLQRPLRQSKPTHPTHGYHSYKSPSGIEKQPTRKETAELLSKFSSQLSRSHSRSRKPDLSIDLSAPKLFPPRAISLQPTSSSQRDSPSRSTSPSLPESPSFLETSSERPILQPRLRRSPPRPTATQLYPDLALDFTQPPEQPEQTAVRKIGGILVAGWQYWYQWVVQPLYNVFILRKDAKERELVAVETDTTGRKRRAIAIEDLEDLEDLIRSTPSPQPGDAIMPGDFLALPSTEDTQVQQATADAEQTLDTPPDSRPGSSDSDATTDGPNRPNESTLPGSAATAQADESCETQEEKEARLEEQARREKDLAKRRDWNSRIPKISEEAWRAKTPADFKAARVKDLALPFNPWTMDYTKEPVPRNEWEPDWTDAEREGKKRNPNRPSDAELVQRANDAKRRLLEEQMQRQARNLENKRVARLQEEDHGHRAENPYTTSALLAKADRMAKRDRKGDVLAEAEEASVPAASTHGAHDSHVREAQEIVAGETEKLKKQAQKEAEEESRQRKEAQEKERKAAEKAAEVFEEVDFKDKIVKTLSEKWEDEVSKVMQITDRTRVVAKTPDGAEITRYTLGKILPQVDKKGKSLESLNKLGEAGAPSNWLDDEAVVGLLTMIVTRNKEQTGFKGKNDEIPEMARFHSGWYTNVKTKGIQSVKTWSRRQKVSGKKLLGAKKIFFPINTGCHWMLLVVKPQERRIEMLDSLNGQNQAILGYARQWLKMELGDDYVADEWTEHDKLSTQQTNYDDCGMFVCMNALACARDIPYSELEAKLMPKARKMLVALLINGGFTGEFDL